MARNKGALHVPEQQQRTLGSKARGEGTSLDTVLLERFRLPLLGQIRSLSRSLSLSLPLSLFLSPSLPLSLCLAVLG